MSKRKKSTKKLLTWFDNHFLAVLAGFFLLFIPLYPKWPLFDIIPGYIVRVRLEDLLVAITVVIWSIQALRKKVEWKNPLFYLIAAYLIVGFLSTLSAMFITKSLPLNALHVGKMYLHYARRIEYFSLLFIFYSAIKTKIHAKYLIATLVIAMIGVTLYGYGQKYLYFPVYSTMNREFAKGWKLYLTEHARVPSTFGGHYDLAAYTMISLTILLSLFFIIKDRWAKLILGLTFVGAFWLLILSASRTSFLAYLLAITVLMFIYLFVKGWKWAIPRWLGVMVFSLFIALSFGDLSERFSQILGLDKVRQFGQGLLKPAVDRPNDYIGIDDISLVTTPSDTPPVPQKPGGGEGGKQLPADVYEDIPLTIVDKDGARVVSRTYSENAYKYGLSAAIRFDALWPRAIAGFQQNPLLGYGYANITKESWGQFTEAESTDNDFLRALGETGLLGFLTFYGTIGFVIYLSLKNLKKIKEPLFLAFTVGMVAAIFGLLLNATYIDVFEASKVAFTFWSLVGLLLAIIFTLSKKSKKSTK